MTDTTIKGQKPDYRTDSNQVIGAFRDLAQGVMSFRIWWNMAVEDFARRYRRSVVGMLWGVFSFIIFAASISWFFGALSSANNREFSLFVIFGFLIFTFISGAILEGCMVFMGSANWIKATNLPKTTFVLQGVTRSLFVFGFNLIGAIIMLVVLQYRPGTNAIWALPGLLMLPINAVWVYIVLGTLSARFPDFNHLMQAIMRMIFFVTPIMWIPDDLGKRGAIAQLNPITYFIDIVREPLLHNAILTHEWVVVLAVTGVGWIAAVITLIAARSKIIYWI